MVFNFQQYFSYILAVSFIGGENHCCKSLTSLLNTTLCDLSLSLVYGRSVVSTGTPPIKQTAGYNWNIVESGVKHNPNHAISEMW